MSVAQGRERAAVHVRRHPPAGRSGVRRFGHILVPVDLGEHNGRALAMALALAVDGHKSRVTLLHVVQRLAAGAPGELEPFYRKLVHRSQAKLRHAARAFSHAGIDVRTEVRVGEPATEIVRKTLREAVDLVVMGSHKVRPGKRERGWGTTSYKVGIFCQCPILLVK